VLAGVGRGSAVCLGVSVVLLQLQSKSKTTAR
jgi:hypothetical protein